ncbi:MAG: hypothetical protein WCF06_01290 [Nitrososphaeraceae archaeon]
MKALSGYPFDLIDEEVIMRVKILRAIDSSGGMVDSREKLEQVSRYGKPLLSINKY